MLLSELREACHLQAPARSYAHLSLAGYEVAFAYLTEAMLSPKLTSEQAKEYAHFCHGALLPAGDPRIEAQLMELFNYFVDVGLQRVIHNPDAVTKEST